MPTVEKAESKNHSTQQAAEILLPDGKPAALAWLTLSMLAIIPFLPALRAGFVWDDQTAIQQNAVLQRLDGLRLIWFTIGRIPFESHWWPLTYTVLWSENKLWGMNPLGFHAVTLGVHALATLQLWRLAKRLNWPGAWLGAALFAVHPVHVEAAAWIIELKGLLAASFYFLAIHFFLNHQESGNWKWIAAATLSAVAMMLCKSSGATLPAGLAILIWHRNGKLQRSDLPALIPIALAVFGMACFDWWVVRQNAFDSIGLPPPASLRILKAFWAFWMYGAKLVWPFQLSLIYPQFTWSPSDVRAWLGLAAFAGVAAALWIFRKRIGRGPLACFAFYFATLAPALGFIHFSFLNQSPIADRYQYLACAAPLLGVAALASPRLAAFKLQAGPAAFFPAAIALGLLACLSWSRAALFQNQTALFRSAVAASPQSASAMTGYGRSLMQEGRLKEALDALQKAVQMDPQLQNAYVGLGVAYAESKRIDDALKAFETAAGLHPRDVMAHYNLGQALTLKNRWEEARSVLEHIARVDPHDAGVAAKLGSVLLHLGDERSAAAIYRGIIDSGDADASIYGALAWVMATSSDSDLRNPIKALDLATFAVQNARRPDAEILRSLAAAQAANGQIQEALANARQARILAGASALSPDLPGQIEALIEACEQGKPYVRANKH